MGRSRLVKSLQHLGRSYLHLSCLSSVKHITGGLSEDHATVTAYGSSCPLSSISTSEEVVSKAFSTSGLYSTEQSSTRRFHTSVNAPVNRQFHSSLHLKHPASAITSVVGREASYCEQRCRISTRASDSGDKETISVTFVDKDGEETQIQVRVGMSMLEAAHENDIELEGACEGSLACSTCHVIVMEEDMYGKLPEPTDEENDMLDLAFGLTETSRLGCQVIAHRELDGLRLALPAATRNFAVDGHVPKPH